MRDFPEREDNGFRGPSKFFVTLRPPTPVPFPYERYDCSFFISPPGQVHKLPGSCNTRRYAWLLTPAAPLTILHALPSLSLSLSARDILLRKRSPGSRSLNRHPAIKAIEARYRKSSPIPLIHYSYVTFDYIDIDIVSIGVFNFFGAVGG